MHAFHNDIPMFVVPVAVQWHSGGTTSAPSGPSHAREAGMEAAVAPAAEAPPLICPLLLGRSSSFPRIELFCIPFTTKATCRQAGLSNRRRRGVLRALPEPICKVALGLWWNLDGVGAIIYHRGLFRGALRRRTRKRCHCCST